MLNAKLKLTKIRHSYFQSGQARSKILLKKRGVSSVVCHPIPDIQFSYFVLSF